MCMYTCVYIYIYIYVRVPGALPASWESSPLSNRGCALRLGFRPHGTCTPSPPTKSVPTKSP